MTYLNASLHVSSILSISLCLQSWFSSLTTQMHHLLILDLTNPICAHSLFVVMLHFSNHSVSLTQHQPYHPAALLIFSKTPSPVMSYFFTGFFYSSPSQLSFILIFPFLPSQGSVASPLPRLSSYADMAVSSQRNSCDHMDFSATNCFSPLSHFILF